MRNDTIAAWFDKWYILLICLVALVVICLQYHNDFGHLAFYQDYARIIRSGLDYRAAIYGPHTCPMWGYAIPVMFTDSKLLFLLFLNLFIMNHTAILIIDFILVLFILKLFLMVLNFPILRLLILIKELCSF